MNNRNRKVSRDKNHHDVALALKRIGCSVADMAMVGSDFPDLLAADRKTAVIFEVKVPDGRFDLGQLKFLANWKGFSAFTTDGEEAVRIFRNPEELSLSEKEKFRILRLITRYEADNEAKCRATGKRVKRPRISVKQFEADFAAEL